jgi:hypothetical protein
MKPGWGNSCPHGVARYLGFMAKVIGKRRNGALVVVVPAADASGLEVGGAVDVLPKPAGSGQDQPWPVGALADELPPIEIADIKAARQEALLGEAE